MQSLRNASRLVARVMLVWWVLFLGSAIASPLIKPVEFQMICSAGGTKFIVLDDDGSQTQVSAGMDCPLCAPIVGAPPLFKWHSSPPSCLSHALRPQVAAHIAWVTASPLPARGPPAQ